MRPYIKATFSLKRFILKIKRFLLKNYELYVPHFVVITVSSYLYINFNRARITRNQERQKHISLTTNQFFQQIERLERDSDYDILLYL